MVADLGTAAVLVVTAAVVFYVAGLDEVHTDRGPRGSGGLVAAVAVKPYRLVRVFGFFDPEYSTLDRFPGAPG